MINIRELLCDVSIKNSEKRYYIDVSNKIWEITKFILDFRGMKVTYGKG